MASRQRASNPTRLQSRLSIDLLSGPVEEALREVDNPDLLRQQRSILNRLKTDKRMEHVWELLLSRKRPSRDFAYPAVQHDKTGSKSAEERQFEAIRELFYCVFCYARDKTSVARPVEIQRSKKTLVSNAKTLRTVANDLDLAATLGQLGVITVQDKLLATNNVVALRLVANWLDHLSTILRRPGDPLLVKRHRGDSVGRGVGKLIALKLKELFGDPLYGTTSTLASVALGKVVTTKTIRSALKDQKAKKRA